MHDCLKAVLNTARDGMALIDARGSVIAINRATVQLSGYAEEDIIRVAGLLHDFGKIFVPTEILIKPGKLNDLELSLIKSHPQSGYNVLKSIEFPWPIADIVVQHHERLDGSGYPARLRYDTRVVEACLDTFLDRDFKWEDV